MKVLIVSFMQRRNTGNYEHQEVKLEASVDAGESPESVMASLKALAHQALYNETIAQELPVTLEASKPEMEKLVDAVMAPIEEKAKKAAPKAKKAEFKSVEEAPVVAEVVVETPKAKPAVKYSNLVAEHKQAFAGYLARTYGDSWKTKQGLKDFSVSLNGKDFLDGEGQILPEFVKLVSDFFMGTENSVL